MDENKWEYNYSSSDNTAGGTGYPNVGSSGMNTANQYNNEPEPQAAAPDAGSTVPPTEVPPQQPAAPEPPKKKKHHVNGGKVARSAVALVLAAVMGFAGGYVGSQMNGSKVVIQQVAPSGSSSSSGSDSSITSASASGSSLTTEQVADLVSPSVVVITTEQVVYSQWSWYGQNQVESGAGSGVIISSDGYILTCAHVVDGASNITVTINDKDYTATLVGEDTTSDIAVIKIDADGLTPATVGDSDSLKVGQNVMAVGNPLGTLSNTVTQGIVSALNRQVTVEDNDMTLIQTDTSISPGNSGGGLFNANGELIGVVNAKSSYSEAEGIGFAIPINTAMDIAQQLIENGAVARPVLGVSILDIQDSSTAQQYGVSALGVYVADVTKGGGAEAAGVQRGDRIIAIDDTAVSSTSTVKSYLADKQVGDTVTLQVERDGKVLTLNVTLGNSAQ